MPPDAWHADGGLLRLVTPRLWLTVNPLDPAGGLAGLHVDSQPLRDVCPLRVELPKVDPRQAECDVDFYVRGGDLIATYAHRPERAMRAQIYWRAASHRLAGAIAAIELLVSVQTNLLDSCPKLSTRTGLTACQALRLSDPVQATFVSVVPRVDRPAAGGQSTEPHCYLFRLPAARYSYAEMVMPTDAQQSELSSEPEGANFQVQLAHQLFAERLEKGVILRARVLGVLLDREQDEAAAASHYASFSNEELPLTT